MIFDTTFVAAVAAGCVGFAAFWANPRRSVNRLFFTCSLHAALWLVCRDRAANDQTWLRVTMSIGAFLPVHLWAIMEAIVQGPTRSFFDILARAKWWALSSSLLALLTFTQWFVPTRTTEEFPPFGVGYYVHLAGLLLIYAVLGRTTVSQMRLLGGARRLELQIVLLGGCAAAVTVLLLMAANAVFHANWLLNLRPLAVLIFFGFTTVGITMTRILDARHILYLGLQKLSLVLGISALSYVIFGALTWAMPDSFAFLTTVAFGLWSAASLNSALDRLFRFYPQGIAARQAAYSAAQREARVENLERAFRGVLCGWGQTDQALILSGSKGMLLGNGIELSGEHPVLVAMHQLNWATPERLERERSTSQRIAVGDFLSKHDLGLLVLAEGPGLTLMVGVGVSASRRPFTYPQVTQLMELASIMESAMERAHFSAKVQHTEQLATVGLLGASLAHEIRNPLVTIKTFVQLLPKHHQDPTFREKFFKLIGDEVNRIDQLTEQLLDLASPRTYMAQMVELHPVLRASLDLVAAKASDKQVQFLTDLKAQPDMAYTDASAAKQVMLNLCFNAIQAVESHTGSERWVRIATRNIVAGIEMIVADSGPGIAAEIRPRLFQPFQTTKSSGFGLGLAICSDILANLNATISVDPLEPGRGATFRVIFPCQPLSS